MTQSNIRRDLEDNMTFVAGYCRLSRDEDKENYASIEEQKRIIIDYRLQGKPRRVRIVIFYTP